MTNPAKRRGTLGVAAVLSVAGLLGGCAEQGYSVIASAGTSLGLDIAQAPTGQLPQFSLGYRRAEHAFVPSNRPSNAKSDGSRIQGADETAEVLMELRYGGGVGTQVDTSIYQRLAVGKVAVSQPGAVALFLRDSSGQLDPAAAQELASVSPLVIGLQQAAADDREVIAACVVEDGAISRERLERLIRAVAEDDDQIGAGVFNRALAAEDPAALTHSLNRIEPTARARLAQAAMNDCR